MSEIENGRLGLYDTEHSKCNHLVTLGFRGLKIWSALEDSVAATTAQAGILHVHSRCAEGDLTAI